MSACTQVYTVIKKVQTTLNADQVTELPLKRRCFPIMLRGCFVVYLFIYSSIVLVISAYCMRLDESVVISCGRRRFTLVLQPLTVVQPPISHLSHRRRNSLGTRSRIQTAAAWVFVQSDWLDNVSSQGSSAAEQRTSGAVPEPLGKHLDDNDNDNNNNCHLINTELITETAAGRIPRVRETMQRATAQIKTRLRRSDRWLRVFRPAERPETPLRGAIIAHRGVWLMEPERRSPLISIHWPPCTSPWLVTLIICHGSDAMSVSTD